MRLRLILAALAAAGIGESAAAASPLPIAQGDYVLSTTPCDDPPFAAMLAYDGHGLTGPHTSHCTTRILSRAATHDTIDTTCTAAGDGTPDQPSTITQSLTILSPRHLVLQNSRPGSAKLDYRWCAAPPAH